MIQDLNDLYYYVKVVEHGGFSPASAVLDIPKSRLSRRIAALEEQLEVRLIQRSTRSFVVTDIGRQFYDRCKIVIEEAETAQDVINLAQIEPKGTVKLSCPTALLNTCIQRILVTFMQQYTQVNIQLVATNRAVDVINEGLDIAIRARPLPLDDTGLTMKVLGYADRCLVASPKLVAQYPAPTSPADLHSWPTLGNGEHSLSYSWSLTGPDEAKVVQHFSPRFVTTDMHALHNAALAGIGAVQLPSVMVNEAISQGQLVRLLPQWQAPQDVIHALFPSRKGLLPAVRALLDYLADHLAKTPLRNPLHQ